MNNAEKQYLQHRNRMLEKENIQLADEIVKLHRENKIVWTWLAVFSLIVLTGMLVMM